MKVMKMTWHDLCWILAVPAVVACNTRTSSEGEDDSSTPMDVLSDAEAPSETTDSDTGSEPLCEGTPSRVVAVSGGVAQCALFDSGHVKCWGRNTEGQLGLGHTENVGDDEHPSESGFVPLAGCATQISHMGFYGCAVLEGGTVQCWGSNEVGQLGLGHTNNIGDDEALSEPLRFDLPVLAVQTGMGTTYALLLDGSIVAWGWNLSNNSSCAGRLGFSSAPDILGDDEPPGPLVEQKTKATRVFPGVIMSCLTDRERRLTCWSGPPAYLGHQDPEAPFDACPPVSPTPAQATPHLLTGPVTALTIGDAHACALVEGEVWCWGDSSFGQLGQGNTEFSMEPVLVDLGAPVIELSEHGHHTCALLTDASVRCWGIGGSLGAGHEEEIGDDELPSSAPVVDLGGEVEHLGRYNCAIMKSGDLRCWGLNNYGQLGLGHTEIIGDDEHPSSVPPIQLL
jgi:hypothetical protein